MMTRKEQALRHIDNKDWESMHLMLQHLSSSELKKMELVLRNDVLTNLCNDIFWETLLHLIIFRRQAFISCVIAADHLVKDGTLTFDNEHTEAIYQHLSETNKESLAKICNMMMPLLNTEQLILSMLSAFHIDSETTRLSVLLKAQTPIAYFILFKELRMIDDNSLVRKCYTIILKRSNDMAYNMCCLLKTYFALDDMPQRFSLSIEQYELSHIERDYCTFCHILTGKRPKI
ncbi:MAG: hypothetical protein MJZ41_11805 [Bacteroidaceae bacterium]|nr:hypothetical protein [Bacteroidaceae bacterium]